ncbi:MAG: hypothetical protein Q8Q25_00920 [bacterium]|nr:hypothetical protein [bacterium]
MAMHKAITMICLITYLSPTLCVDSKIILESTVLKLVDGVFFNADRIEDIRSLQFQITNLLYGERTSEGTRMGNYLFQGKKYNVIELRALEEQLFQNNGQENLKTPEQLRPLLETIKKEFLVISSAHKEQARIGKSFIAILMTESCNKHNRKDSLLRIWAHAKTQRDEDDIFEKHVLTFKSLVLFLGDISNFLTDLINSCPKACDLFIQRVEKFKAVKILLPAALKKTKITIDEMAFLKNLKAKRLDTLTLEKITLELVCNLVMTFVSNQKITA